MLTDSDAAGFRIRNYVNKIAVGLPVKNAYVPALAGKEKRKSQPSKERTLGVEGVPAEAILQALRTAGAHPSAERQEDRLPIRICLNWACPERREVQAPPHLALSDWASASLVQKSIVRNFEQPVFL